jgi:hypothetical protein
MQKLAFLSYAIGTPNGASLQPDTNGEVNIGRMAMKVGDVFKIVEQANLSAGTMQNAQRPLTNPFQANRPSAGPTLPGSSGTKAE